MLHKIITKIDCIMLRLSGYTKEEADEWYEFIK